MRNERVGGLIESKSNTLMPIEEYIPRVRGYIFKRYVRICRCWDDIEELQSEGMRSLVAAYARIERRPKRNPNAYIFVALIKDMQGYVQKLVDRRIHEQPTDNIDLHTRYGRKPRESDPSRKLTLLDELEQEMNSTDKLVYECMKEGENWRDIARMRGIKQHTIDCVSNRLRVYAARIIRRRYAAAATPVP